MRQTASEYWRERRASDKRKRQFEIDMRERRVAWEAAEQTRRLAALRQQQAQEEDR